MIRNYSRTFHWGRLVSALLLATLLAPAAQAQAPLPDSLKPTPGVYRHALRLDVGGILARNLASSGLGNSGILMPLLLGYERQLRPRLSANAEVLVNGGSPEERAWGLAAQGRYYYYQGRQTGLVGLYAAPTLSYRGIQQESGYGPEVVRRKLGGVGVLLGAQLPLGAQRRFLLDVSGGLMSWTRIGQDKIQNYRRGGGYYEEETYYENGSVFDGRISLGYRF
ncbi:hypothetical protein HNQ93_003046 [Hymenobacter luteus]|uniref:DUF3575 domain-containing protein n=2 Tax=Hymenobacter TaxID=89966 RepID=A0A7W9T3B4_9BACT|nr:MULTISPECIES: hypothetical protein [Hymenobacter]MBB4603282.1 hypothetical protein [Hymenobacter latericoloratus]MBB6060180.1 hypothetical protein [Hymenobacter luteus]